MAYNYYLAGPWFTEKEEEIHNKIVAMLQNDLLVRTRDVDIVNPREYKVPHGDKLTNSEWGYEVYSHDLSCIAHCDTVFAILFGQYMDSGTAMEVGYARAKGCRVVGILVNPEETHSCMVINACDVLVGVDFRTIDKRTITVK